jgi:hypothetical protein
MRTVEWLAPTLGSVFAALFAGYIAVYVSRRSDRTARALSLPLLSFTDQLDTSSENFTRWVVDVRNDGQGAATIESLTVVAGDEIVVPGPLEPPDQYWTRVLYRLGVIQVQMVTGNLVLPPRTLGPHAELLLFDAILREPRAHLSRLLPRLQIRLKGHSALGDSLKLTQRFGQRISTS